MDVFVLGDPHLRVGGPERPFPAGRPGRLLASLLLARGRVVTDDRLVDDVWGEDLPVDARAALHTTVGRARRALGPEGTRIGRTAAGYRLDLTGVVFDADRFAAGLARARALEDGGRLAAYDEALALWRGPAWAGLAVDVAQGEALRLEEAHVAAREERAEVLLVLGRAREAADELRQLVAEQPLRDRPSLLLMRALHRLGASAEALAVYAVHRTALAEELGLDPSPELDEAQRQILERTPDPARSSGTTHATTGDLTGDSTRLPTAIVSDLGPTRKLIGRDDDVEQVRALAKRHRCVTVVGPGGVGKTSLARAVASTEQVAWWGDLTSVSTEAGVRALIATALGVEVFAGGSAEAALHRRLETVTGLLVLDNCEHVLAAVGDLVTVIAAAGAGIRVLATSRERLGLPVEQVYPLAPLRLPGARRRRRGRAVGGVVPRTCARLGPRPRGHAERRPRRCRARPSARRPPPRHRARREPGGRGQPCNAARPARRPAGPAAVPPPARACSTPDPGRHDRLVLRTPRRGPTAGAAMALGVRRPLRPGRGGGRARPGLDRAGARSRRAVPTRSARADAGRVPDARDRPCLRAGLAGRRRARGCGARAREVGGGCGGSGMRRDVGPGRGVVDRAGRGPAARVRPGGILGYRDRPGGGGDAHRRRPVLLGRLPRPCRRHGVGTALDGVGARRGRDPSGAGGRLVVLVDGG